MDVANWKYSKCSAAKWVCFYRQVLFTDLSTHLQKPVSSNHHHSTTTPPINQPNTFTLGGHYKEWLEPKSDLLSWSEKGCMTIPLWWNYTVSILQRPASSNPHYITTTPLTDQPSTFPSRGHHKEGLETKRAVTGYM